MYSPAPIEMTSAIAAAIPATSTAYWLLVAVATVITTARMLVTPSCAPKIASRTSLSRSASRRSSLRWSASHFLVRYAGVPVAVDTLNDAAGAAGVVDEGKAGTRPGGHPALEVLRGIAGDAEALGCPVAPAAAPADGHDGAVARHLVQACAEVAQGDVLSALDMSVIPFVGLAYVKQMQLGTPLAYIGRQHPSILAHGGGRWTKRRCESGSCASARISKLPSNASASAWRSRSVTVAETSRSRTSTRRMPRARPRRASWMSRGSRCSRPRSS